MRGVYFKWIENKEKSLGVIAQEIEKVLPELVYENDSGYKSVSYGHIVAVIIEAIKEQQNKIIDLEFKINNIKN